ncbi:hypothetical protein Hanom_Chr07g00665351 [Helianthus anomalus]
MLPTPRPFQYWWNNRHHQERSQQPRHDKGSNPATKLSDTIAKQKTKPQSMKHTRKEKL